MKRIGLSFFFICIHNICFACICNFSTANEKFFRSDLVAYVQVQKVYPNASRADDLYRILIEPIEVFKGTAPKDLWVYGESDGIPRNDCGLDVPENSKWIIYAQKTANGGYSISLCSGSWQTDRYIDTVKYPDATANNRIRIDKELESARFLGKTMSHTHYNNRFSQQLYNPIYTFLQPYKGISFQKSFAQYIINFGPDLKILSVKPLSGLNRKFDKRFISFIRNLKLKPSENIGRSDGQSIVMGIYYYDDSLGKYLSVDIF